MERSKFVATKEDLVKIKNVLSNTDAIEECTEKDQIQSGNFANLLMSPFCCSFQRSSLGL